MTLNLKNRSGALKAYSNTNSEKNLRCLLRIKHHKGKISSKVREHADASSSCSRSNTKIATKNIVTKGPIEIVDNQDKRLRIKSKGLRVQNVEFFRNSNCKNYQNCLAIAASLNWHSFTCFGCSGSLNSVLSWEVLRKAKNDKIGNYFLRNNKQSLIKKLVMR
jgi:hypothetical protein